MNQKTKQQVREIRNKIIKQVERRPQYDSDDEVITHAVQQFYEDLKQRRILKWKLFGTIDLQRWQIEREIFRPKFFGAGIEQTFRQQSSFLFFLWGLVLR